MRDKIEYAIDCILCNESHGFYDTTMRFRHEGVEWYICRNYAGVFTVMAEVPVDDKGVIQDVVVD